MLWSRVRLAWPTAPASTVRVTLDALRVRARPGVLRLQRARERRDGLEVRALQKLALPALDLQHVSQVSRVEQQRLIGAPRTLLRRPKGNAEQAACKSFRNSKQLERAERLEHEGVGADLLRLCAGAAVRAGQEHDRDLAGFRRGLQLGTELEPGRAGHVDVEHDHVRPGTADLPAGSGGVFGFDNCDVGNLERRLHQSAKCRIVVDEQDPQVRASLSQKSEWFFRQRARRT